MKIKLLATIVIGFILMSSKGVEYGEGHQSKEIDYRPYYQKREKAKKYLQQESYSEAYKIYNELFKEYDPTIGLNARDYTNFIKSAELSNTCYSKFEMMKVLIGDLGYNKDWIESDKILHTIYLNSGIDNEIYEILRNRYLTSINYEIRSMVVEMIKRDQKYRRGYGGKDRMDKMKAADAINARAIKTIFDKFGYPNAKLIGNNTIDEEFIELTFVLRHTSDSLKENYIFPKLLEFVKEGTCLPVYYKSLSDGHQLMKGQPSLLEYSDQMDKAIIDKNRYDAGLYVGD